jgi:hypothetical protein
LVAILWDLDNVSPGVDPERARITARRLRDAASRLGGGALGGGGAANGEDEAGPAEVVAFLGFANDATLEKVSAEALREEGVDVRRAKSTPDAADMDLGAHVCGFARAWETQTKAQNSKSVANVPPPPPFVTPRALAAAEADAVLKSASRSAATADSSAASAAASDARAALASAAAEAERAAFEHFVSIFHHARRRVFSDTKSGASRGHVGQRRRARGCLRAAKRVLRRGVRRFRAQGLFGGRRRAGEQASARQTQAFRIRRRGGRDARVLVDTAKRREQTTGGPIEARRRVGRRVGLGLDPFV